MRFGLNQRNNKVATLLQAAAILAVVLFAAMPTGAQNGARAGAATVAAEKPTPHTSDGHPDLTGFWNNPLGGNATQQFQRATDGSILFDFSTAFNDNKTCVGLDPTCQAANQPPYKPEYMSKVKEIGLTMNGGTTPLDPMTDCRPNGIPRSFGPMRIVQTPELVVILYEGIPYSTYRIVYMNSEHPKDYDTTFLGDSRGHWDGDTLVVDVTGLNDETWLGGDVPGHVKLTTIHSEKEHVVERWTRKGDTLTYQATVEDPVMFTKPWTPAPRRLQIADQNDTLYETVCSPDRAHFTPPAPTDTGCNYRCTGAAETK
jgi:hypothetical protein